MKMRTDFVSNSSSSSFILQNSELFEHFNITKTDLGKAMLLARDEEPTDANLKKHLGKTFWIYDVKDPKEKKKAIREMGVLLSQWTTRYVRKDAHSGELYATEPFEFEQANELVKSITRIWGLHIHNIADVPDFVKNTKHSDWERYEASSTTQMKSVPVEMFLRKTLVETKKRIGIMTNLDALKSPCSRFLVHYADNECFEGRRIVWPSKNAIKRDFYDFTDDVVLKNLGNDVTQVIDCNQHISTYNHQIDISRYETEEYTVERYMEVLFESMVQLGLIRCDDEDFLKLLSSPQPDVFNKKYTTKDGLTYSAADFTNELLAFTAHEG